MKKRNSNKFYFLCFTSIFLIFVLIAGFLFFIQNNFSFENSKHRLTGKVTLEHLYIYKWETYSESLNSLKISSNDPRYLTGKFENPRIYWCGNEQEIGNTVVYRSAETYIESVNIEFVNSPSILFNKFACLQEGGNNYWKEYLECVPNNEASDEYCNSIIDFYCRGYCDSQGRCSENFTACNCDSEEHCPDDGNICTSEFCYTHSGNIECLIMNNSLLCSDGNDCTINDTCSEGVCRGIPITGNLCDDGKWCTINDTCLNGSCDGTSRICPRNDNPCAIPICLENENRCGFDYTSCQCIIDEDCPENENFCTSIICDEGTCVSKNINKSCNDNNPCTENDKCINKTCQGKLINVSDGNPLTYDVCLDNGTIIHRALSLKKEFNLENNINKKENFSYNKNSFYSNQSSNKNPKTNSSEIGDSKRKNEKSESLEKTTKILIWVFVVIFILGILFFIFWKFLKNFNNKDSKNSEKIRQHNYQKRQFPQKIIKNLKRNNLNFRKYKK